MAGSQSRICLMGRRAGAMGGAQDLMDDPNPLSPAQSDAYMLFMENKTKYSRLVREQAARFPPPA